MINNDPLFTKHKFSSSILNQGKAEQWHRSTLDVFLKTATFHRNIHLNNLSNTLNINTEQPGSKWKPCISWNEF